MIKFWKSKNTTSILLAVFFSLIVYSSRAQYNLVLNSSFEMYISCPSNTSSIVYPINWYPPCKASPSYVNICDSIGCFGVPHNCFGSGNNYQYAKTGFAYIGVLTFYKTNTVNNQRTYLQTKLTDSLFASKYYYISFYTNLPNGLKYAGNNVSLLLTKNASYVDTVANQYGVLPANPQIYNYGNPIIADTVNWIKVSGIYIAEGGEKYITIGNFKSDTETQKKLINISGYDNRLGYSIDDVSVIPLDSMPLQADAGKDTTITIGDSVFIGSLTNGIDSLKWQIQNTGIAIDSTRPGFWVHPLVNTCYVLTQTVNGFTSSDTACINVLPLPLKFLKYGVRSTNENPSSLRGTKQSVENIWVTANEINVSHFNILKSVNGVNFKAIGKMKAQNKSYNEYSFIDGVSAPSPLREGWGEVYYKIAAIDFDGKMSFSEVRKINSNYQLSTINVYPNPTNGLINVKLPAIEKGSLQISITDVYGKKVAEKKIEQNTMSTQLNIVGAKGLYFINVYNSTTGKQQISKIILQ